MIIWSGRGILILLFSALGLAVGGFAGAFFDSERWTAFFTFSGVAAANWLFALTLGKTQLTHLVDPSTGRPVVLTKKHTLFFLPPKFWAVAASVLALFMLVGLGNQNGARSDAGNPAAAAFSQADELIMSARKGSAHGSSPEAKALAEAFAKDIKTLRDEGIAKGRSSGFSLTKGDFLTYCLLQGRQCVFMVHVPQLRHFSAEAKEFISEAGWVVALKALEEAGLQPESLVVGVRGSILYDRVIVGRSGPASDYETLKTAAITGNSESRDKLVECFADAMKSPAASAGPAAQPVPAAAANDNDTQGNAKEAAAAPAVEETAAAPAAGEVTAAPPPTTESLSAMRTWTDSTGRTMRAQFVRFSPASQDTAEFKREDGQSFAVPMARFSAADQDFIKSHPDLKN